jgi:uncharacterized protein (DUF1786 family)
MNEDALTRLKTCASRLWPASKLEVRSYASGWVMDIHVDASRLVVIEYRTKMGFGASVIEDDISSAFTGHDQAFDSAEQVEKYLEQLVHE